MEYDESQAGESLPDSQDGGHEGGGHHGHGDDPLDWLRASVPGKNTMIHRTMGLKIYKKSSPKKLVKSNKSISRKEFLAKIRFLQFQKWPKINFCNGKKFKTANNAISRKKMIYLTSLVFLPGLF